MGSENNSLKVTRPLLYNARDTRELIQTVNFGIPILSMFTLHVTSTQTQPAILATVKEEAHIDLLNHIVTMHA